MASIKCKSCGRVYNYRSSELCPKCGAYNRPPHQMRVGFDENGSVELQSDREFRENISESTTVEETVREVGETLLSSETLDALGRELNKWGSRVEKWWTENSEKSATHAKVAKDSPLRDRKKSKSGSGRIVAIVVVIIIFSSLIGSITESCSSNGVHIIAPEPDVSIATEEVAPSAEIWQDEGLWPEEARKDLLDIYGVTDVFSMGTGFNWNGTTMWINGWEISGSAGDGFIVLGLEADRELPENTLNECYLLWWDVDGTEHIYHPTAYRNGALIFEHLHTDVFNPDAAMWLLCEHYRQSGEDANLYEYLGTTAVELN